MTRSLPRIPSLPLFIATAIVVAVLAFAATHWFAQRGGGDALPQLQLQADSQASQTGIMDVSKLFATRTPATVMIQSDMGADTPLTGAGVVLGADGTIVTASHVVHDYDANRDATSVTVQFSDDGQTVRDEVPAQVVARDHYNDLAVLKIDPSRLSKPLVAARLSTGSLLPGADVAEIGQPFGNQWTITKGIVSNVHRSVASRMNASWAIPDAIQFDVPTNPGNSGGPLFDARGDVVGIVQQIDSPNAANTGVSFAISAQIVARTLELSKQYTDIPYAYTGITSTRSLTPQLARATGIGVSQGALVQKVSGPAQQAGLSAGSQTVGYAGEPVSKGDVIVAVAGQPVTDSNQLARLLGMANPGALVDLEIVRGGKHMTLQLKPERQP